MGKVSFCFFLEYLVKFINKGESFKLLIWFIYYIESNLGYTFVARLWGVLPFHELIHFACHISFMLMKQWKGGCGRYLLITLEMSAESTMMNSSSMIFVTHRFCPLSLQYFKDNALLSSGLYGCWKGVSWDSCVTWHSEFFSILNAFKVFSLFLVYKSCTMCAHLYWTFLSILSS